MQGRGLNQGREIQLFSFIWNMTYWNRLDIKNTTGGKPNKSTRFLFALWQNLAALAYHNAMHNNRLKPVRIPLSAVEWFDMRFNRSLHAWYCVRQGCQICSKCKQINLVLLFGFPPVAIYCFWVGVIPFELWSNEFT